MITKTYKFKVSQRHRAKLGAQARKVNFIWNYCNQISYKAIKDYCRFPTGYDLNYLTAGTSVLLNIHSTTVQSTCETFAKSRKQAGKRKLRWRTRKSLGWIPFKASAVKIVGNKIKFGGKWFKFFKSQEIEGQIATGAFVADACGDWYVCLVSHIDPLPQAPDSAIGVDLGLIDLAVTSAGEKFENPRTYRKNELKLANAQRHKKRRATRTLHRKIRRIRQDNLHKISAKLSSEHRTIFVGDLSLKSTKSTNDAAYRGLVNLLEYKVSRRQGVFVLVGEAHTTVTCSRCLSRSGPSGVEDLRVREWTCGSCGQTHDRDVNAARNILRLGHETLKTREQQLAKPSEGIPRPLGRGGCQRFAYRIGNTYVENKWKSSPKANRKK